MQPFLFLGICGLVQLTVEYTSIHICGAWSLLPVQDECLPRETMETSLVYKKKPIKAVKV